MVGYDALRIVGLLAMGCSVFLERTLVMEAEGAAGRKDTSGWQGGGFDGGARSRQEGHGL